MCNKFEDVCKPIEFVLDTIDQVKSSGLDAIQEFVEKIQTIITFIQGIIKDPTKLFSWGAEKLKNMTDLPAMQGGELADWFSGGSGSDGARIPFEMGMLSIDLLSKQKQLVIFGTIFGPDQGHDEKDPGLQVMAVLRRDHHGKYHWVVGACYPSIVEFKRFCPG